MKQSGDVGVQEIEEAEVSKKDLFNDAVKSELQKVKDDNASKENIVAIVVYNEDDEKNITIRQQ